MCKAILTSGAYILGDISRHLFAIMLRGKADVGVVVGLCEGEPWDLARHLQSPKPRKVPRKAPDMGV